jgi:hypothetical protein
LVKCTQIAIQYQYLREGLFPKMLGKIIFGILRGVEDGKANVSELVMRRVLFCLTPEKIWDGKLRILINKQMNYVVCSK